MKYDVIKRCADIMISGVAIPVLLPLFALISAAICIDSKGAPIFRQPREGKNSEIFVCYKFRTMTDEAPHNMPKAGIGDPSEYVTRVGRWLRKSSLDELPQLFNVLVGDMSLVGPRPVIEEDRDLLRLRSLYGVKKAKPGMTGLAQVCGRDLLSPEEKAMLDRFYVSFMSFGADLRICLYTVKKVLGQKNIRY